MGGVCSSVWSEPEHITSSSKPSKTSIRISASTASPKIKRQFTLNRPPNYSPFVGDAAIRNADTNAQIISQVDQKDSNGNYNYAYVPHTITINLLSI